MSFPLMPHPVLPKKQGPKRLLFNSLLFFSPDGDLSAFYDVPLLLPPSPKRAVIICASAEQNSRGSRRITSIQVNVDEALREAGSASSNPPSAIGVLEVPSGTTLGQVLVRCDAIVDNMQIGIWEIENYTSLATVGVRFASTNTVFHSTTSAVPDIPAGGYGLWYNYHNNTSNATYGAPYIKQGDVDTASSSSHACAQVDNIAGLTPVVIDDAIQCSWTGAAKAASVIATFV